MQEQLEATNTDRFNYHLKAKALINSKKYFNATKGYPWGSYIDKTVGKICKTAAIETFSYAYVLFLIKKVKKRSSFYSKCFLSEGCGIFLALLWNFCSLFWDRRLKIMHNI